MFTPCADNPIPIYLAIIDTLLGPFVIYGIGIIKMGLQLFPFRGVTENDIYCGAFC